MINVWVPYIYNITEKSVKIYNDNQQKITVIKISGRNSSMITEMKKKMFASTSNKNSALSIITILMCISLKKYHILLSVVPLLVVCYVSFIIVYPKLRDLFNCCIFFTCSIWGNPFTQMLCLINLLLYILS